MSCIRKRHRAACRDGAALDALVILLALIALSFWAAGNAFLVFFPVDTNDSRFGTNVPSGSAAFNFGTKVSEPAATNLDSEKNSTTKPAEINSITTLQNRHSQPNRLAAEGASSNPLVEQQAQEMGNLKQQLAKMQSEIDRYAENELQRDSDNRERSQELEFLRSELLQAKKDLESERADHKSKLSELQDASLNAEIRQLKEDNDELNAKLVAQKELTQKFENERADSNPAELDRERSSDANDPLPVPVFRKWKGQNGRVVEMAFVRRDSSGQLIFIGKDNRLFSFTLDRLSDEDQKLIESTNQ